MANSSFRSVRFFLFIVVLESATTALSARRPAIIDEYSSAQGRNDTQLELLRGERRLATQQWCVAKPNLGNSVYQNALNWVCGPQSGQGQVNCEPLNPGAECFLPDTLQSHSSWAFNVYYQTHGKAVQACDFQGAGVITFSNPSTPTCAYGS